MTIRSQLRHGAWIALTLLVGIGCDRISQTSAECYRWKMSQEREKPEGITAEARAKISNQCRYVPEPKPHPVDVRIVPKDDE